MELSYYYNLYFIGIGIRFMLNPETFM